MRIETLTIHDGLFSKEFFFSEGNNLVHSKKNSVGKTTLLRALLYSLGYNIPGTKKFSLDKREIELVVVNDSGEKFKLIRKNANYLICDDGEGTLSFCLPEQADELHALFFNTEDINVLDNILGVFYLDQEKGWTLLNRGMVIGSNHFNVEDFIQGLSGRDCSELKRKKMRLEQELTKYSQISNVTKYKESLDRAGGSILKENPDDELIAQIQLRQIELNRVKSEMARIDRTLQNNRQVKRFIEEMKLTVVSPKGEHIKVTADNILDLNDSLDYLIAKRKIKTVEYNKILATIHSLQEQKKERETVFFTVESIADAFDEMVQKFPYGYEKVESIKESLQKQLKDIKSLITEKTKHNNEVLNSLYGNVIKYAEELGVIEEGKMPRSYLFTSNLKVLSGALLHKTVFAFRLAYIIEVKRILEVTLPIILDSPSGKEVDVENIKKMIDILKRDFSDHQLIIASIFEYDLPDINRIEIRKRLLEDD